MKSKPKSKRLSYDLGTRFRVANSGVYILAQVDPGRIKLISIEDGNRYSDNVVNYHHFSKVPRSDVVRAAAGATIILERI